MGKHLKNGFVASLNAIVFYLSESQSKQVKLEPHDSIRRLWTLTSTSWRACLLNTNSKQTKYLMLMKQKNPTVMQPPNVIAAKGTKQIIMNFKILYW